MDQDLLHRSDAPFGDEVWKLIDEAVIGAGKSTLSARKLIYIEGPYGLGFATLPGGERVVEERTIEGATISTPSSVPVMMIRSDFKISKRDIAVFEKTGVSFNLGNAAAAAIACAAREDSLIFYGYEDLGLKGLLTVNGVQKAPVGDWTKVGSAAENIIKAITVLDNAGFHGPYAGAFPPELYNKLFRRYPQGGTEFEHLGMMLSDGIIKSGMLKNGGVIIATGPQYVTIVVGQDMTAGFAGPSGGDYELTVSESIALRLKVPGAVCVLE